MVLAIFLETWNFKFKFRALQSVSSISVLYFLLHSIYMVHQNKLSAFLTPSVHLAPELCRNQGVVVNVTEESGLSVDWSVIVNTV